MRVSKNDDVRIARSHANQSRDEMVVDALHRAMRGIARDLVHDGVGEAKMPVRHPKRVTRGFERDRQRQILIVRAEAKLPMQIAAHGKRWSDALQRFQDRGVFEIARVQDEIATVEQFVNALRQFGDSIRNVRVR